MAAGIYLTLSRIVVTFGAQNSRIKPLSYPRIFIPCDIVSLVLQAAGGGLASTESHTNRNPAPGDHIMVAGLAFQVLTLGVFMGLCLDFVLKTLSRRRALGHEALDPTHEMLRASWAFRGFLVALCLATICIFIRSVYRVAELGEGWEGHLIKTQHLFIWLEGFMVILAVLSLNLFHPGFCFREGYVSKWRKAGKVGKMEKGAEESGSERDGGSPEVVEK